MLNPEAHWGGSSNLDDALVYLPSPPLPSSHDDTTSNPAPRVEDWSLGAW